MHLAVSSRGGSAGHGDHRRRHRARPRASVRCVERREGRRRGSAVDATERRPQLAPLVLRVKPST
ncbi:MAG: hypothetical protein ACK559_16775, partial [bacterium]